MTVINWIALILLIVGGFNWLLVGALEFDLIAAVFGDMTALSRTVYVLVGIAAIYALIVSPRLATPAVPRRSAP